MGCYGLLDDDLGTILCSRRLVTKIVAVLVSMRLRCCILVHDDNLIPRSWPDDERGNRLMSLPRSSTRPGRIAVRRGSTQVIRVLMRNRWTQRDKTCQVLGDRNSLSLALFVDVRFSLCVILLLFLLSPARRHRGEDMPVGN